LLEERGEKRRIAMEVPHWMTAMFIVGQSDLIASASTRFVHAVKAAAGVRAFEIPLPAPLLRYDLHWHSRHTSDPAHAWMRQLIIDASSVPARRRRAAAS
jgi:DNA-binding transcriptional LysR family regulator